MAIKYSMLGLLVYAAMVAYLLAGLGLATRYLPSRFHAVRWGMYPHVFVTRLTKVGWIFYIIGFLISISAIIIRAINVDHIPLRSMFEIMLFMGMAMFPVSVFSRQVLRVGGEAVDAFVAALVLFPAGFVFPTNIGHLPPALQSPLFGPHVIAYLLAYAILAKAAVQAFALLITPGNEIAENPDCSRAQAMNRMVKFGFPMLTAGLLLGSVWGKMAWGDYWNWDPKEMLSLATWLVFAGYFHMNSSPRLGPRLRAAAVLLGFVLILATLLMANLTRIFGGMHSYTT